MMPVCMSYTKHPDSAVEVFNSAMMKVFQSLKSYSGEAALGAWVRRVVVNTCIDYLRKETRFQSQKPQLETSQFHYNQNIISELSAEEILSLVHKLPETHQLVFNLYVLEGFTHKEIAERLSISVGTSKWYLNKARGILKTELEKIGIHKLEL